MRIVNVAAAQMGPIQKADSREAVVKRMIALMDEAKAKGADLIVYPELALTTFFPRWYVEDRAEFDNWFERDMPSAATRPLFERAAQHQMAMNFGYAELTPDGHHFNTAILTDKSGKIVGKYRKVHLPGHVGVRHQSRRTSIWRSAISSRAISASTSGASWAASSAWPSATTAAGRRPIASWACRASRWC